MQIHQGGFQGVYTGPTSPTAGVVSGEILDIVSRLDDDVDVVVSGHTHAFTNALLPTASGEKILVVQAFSASTAYDDVRLLIDGCTGDVVAKSATVQSFFSTAASPGKPSTPR